MKADHAVSFIDKGGLSHLLLLYGVLISNGTTFLSQLSSMPNASSSVHLAHFTPATYLTSTIKTLMASVSAGGRMEVRERSGAERGVADGVRAERRFTYIHNFELTTYFIS